MLDRHSFLQKVYILSNSSMISCDGGAVNRLTITMAAAEHRNAGSVRKYQGVRRVVRIRNFQINTIAPPTISCQGTVSVGTFSRTVQRA